MPVQNDHISASFSDRWPAYANWYYVGLAYITEQGNRVTVASHSLTLYSVKKKFLETPMKDIIFHVTERRGGIGAKNVGKPVGFGKHKEEIIKDWDVSIPEFKQHPDGILIRVKEGARGLLAREINKGRPTTSNYTPEEQESFKQLDLLQGEVMEVMADECIPQMSAEQFWNTMPTERAPAGFFLPRGLCDVVDVDSDEIVGPQ